MVDAQAIMSLEILAVKEQAKVYGPVIPRLVGISASKFVAEKLGEATPAVNNLDQAVDYLTKSQSLYPKAFTALAYGVYKAGSTLEGNSGASTRIFKSIMRKIMESMGLGKMLGREQSTCAAITKNTSFNEDMNVVEKGITKVTGDSNTAVNAITGCDYIDVCNKLAQEGIFRAASCGLSTVSALSDAATAAMLTGSEHEYRVLRFDPPICEYKVFKL